MSNPAPQDVTPEQIKKAGQLGYASFMQHAAKASTVEGVKSATDTAEKLKGLVANYGSRLDKKASRLEAVAKAIIEPVTA